MRRSTAPARLPRPVLGLASLASLALLVALPLGAGCTGDLDMDEGGAPPPAEDAADSANAGGPGTTATTAGPTDQALAEAVLLVDGDFGGTWDASWPAGPAHAGRPERFTELGSCLGDPLIGDDDVAAHSRTYSDFSLGDVAASVIVTPSSADAEALMQLVGGPDAVGCYAEVIRGEVAEGEANAVEVEGVEADLGEPTAERLALDQIGEHGDDSVAIRVSTPFTFAGGTTPIVLDTVYVRVGRVVMVTALGSAGDFEPTLAAGFIEKMVDRVPPDAAG